MEDSKVYVTLHGVKNPRLFLCQVSVALQEGLLPIFHWYSKPNSCRNIYIQRAGLKNFIFVQSHIFGHIPHGLLNPLVTCTVFGKWLCMSKMSDQVQYTSTIDAGHQ